MFDYLRGKITKQFANYITVDVNGVGYKIYVSNPYFFKINNEYKIYIYQNIKEDENTLYGFKDIEQKKLFLKLIDVKGVGCKMALPMFATGSIDGITDAIERENILYLKKFPKIGEKVAKQIILDLKGKLNTTIVGKQNSNFDELVEVLKGLGYKLPDINKILPSIKSNLSIEDQVKEALKLMLK
jgi:Holliday junction DNA helicase RuvA